MVTAVPMVPAQAATVAGVCGVLNPPTTTMPMELTLSSSNAVLVPGPMSWGVSASGTCLDSDGMTTLGSGSLSGTISSATVPTTAVRVAGCVSGVSEGTLTFNVSSTGPVGAAAKVVHVGAVLVIVVTRTPLSGSAPLFAGTGVFVLDPVKTPQTYDGVVACGTASNNVTLHFLGTFAFAQS